MPEVTKLRVFVVLLFGVIGACAGMFAPPKGGGYAENLQHNVQIMQCDASATVTCP